MAGQEANPARYEVTRGTTSAIPTAMLSLIRISAVGEGDKSSNPGTGAALGGFGFPLRQRKRGPAVGTPRLLRGERFEHDNEWYFAWRLSRLSSGDLAATQEDCVKAEPTLKRKVIQGSVLVMAGFAVSSALRLGGNLVLTRLLFPEAFGLMAIVQVVVVGVQLFSDMGIRGSIIYHERGEDSAFLNTAWTLQIMRGVFLWLVIAAITWPATTFYEKPELLVLLPVVGLSAIIDGLSSTALFTLIRRIDPARQVMLELGTTLISLCVMIAWAMIWRSIWALVAGALVMALTNAICSHLLIPG